MGRVVPVEEMEALGERLRAEGRRIVFTNGHFDLLHTGHLRYLEAAAGLGDVLIVGINDDRTTTARKGPGRPVIPENERAELVAALECVDYATIFHDMTAERVVSMLRPDIYVKGGDYGPGGAALPEAAVVESYGGRVEILPLVPGRSTTAIVEAIREGRSVR